jgi:SAM-dependent methyltransferase
MELISTFEALDNYLADAESRLGDDEKRAAWAALRVDPQLWGDYPSRLRVTDPFSAEYEATVSEFICHIRWRDYRLSDEVLEVDVEHLSTVPFPYVTRSPATVGGFLVAYGHIIRTLDLPVPSRILDIGSGPGSLTIHLARMGYELTCVDVNPQFIELLRRMTQALPNTPELLCGDMNAIDLQGTYDAIIFFESFHHSRDPVTTLRRLRPHLAPTGCFAFAAEPIVDEPCEVLPYPWGPRLDGETLRAIRRFGWIEWGFTWPYFRELLERSGLTVHRSRNPSSHWADIVIARAPVCLEAGDRLDFASEGRGLQCLCAGWSDSEDFGTWSCDDLADVQFALGISLRDSTVLLIVDFVVFLALGSERREVEVSVNGRAVASWAFEGRTPVRVTREVVVPPELRGQDATLRLRFRVVAPVSPKELGLSNDPRRLGLALSSIEVTAARPDGGLVARLTRLVRG